MSKRSRSAFSADNCGDHCHGDVTTILHIGNLKEETVRIIASYLLPSNAVNLSRTCQELHSQLSLSSTLPRLVFEEAFLEPIPAVKKYGFQLPVTTHAMVHSMTLRMTWSDVERSGWQGRFFVVENDYDETTIRSGQEPVFNMKQCVSEGATRETRFKYQGLQLTFPLRPNHCYHLWYAVTNPVDVDVDEVVARDDVDDVALPNLALLRFKVQYLVHEDSQLHPFQKAHDFLVKSKSFRPRDRMQRRGFNPCDGTAGWKELEEVHSDAVTSILESARHLLEKGLQMPPPMATFFDNFGVSEELLTPTMIELINNIWREQEQAIDNIWREHWQAEDVDQAVVRPFNTSEESSDESFSS